MDRAAIPKNNSFTSVTDVLLIQVASEADTSTAPTVKVAQQPSPQSQSPMLEQGSNQNVALSKSVRFGLIDQRIYNRIVGDHPDVKVGPPITFSWEYGVLPSTPIDEYEQQKQRSMSSSSSGTRYQTPYNNGLRRLSSITRKNMLRTRFDISDEEINAAEREVQLIQKQRTRSVSQSTASAVVESNFRRAGRKVRKSIGKIMLAMSTLPLPNYTMPAY